MDLRGVASNESVTAESGPMPGTCNGARLPRRHDGQAHEVPEEDDLWRDFFSRDFTSTFRTGFTQPSITSTASTDFAEIALLFAQPAMRRAPIRCPSPFIDRTSTSWPSVGASTILPWPTYIPT